MSDSNILSNHASGSKFFFFVTKSYFRSIDGENAAEKGDYEKAIELFTEAIKWNPRNTVAIANRSAIYYQQKKYSASLEDCQIAIEFEMEAEEPSKELLAVCLRRMGEMYFEGGEYFEAVRYLKQSYAYMNDKETSVLIEKLDAYLGQTFSVISENVNEVLLFKKFFSSLKLNIFQLLILFYFSEFSHQIFIFFFHQFIEKFFFKSFFCSKIPNIINN